MIRHMKKISECSLDQKTSKNHRLKIHHCEECGFASSRRNGLERHQDAVHNKGDKKYKCEQCRYSAAENSKLKKHIEKEHGMARAIPVKDEDGQNTPKRLKYHQLITEAITNSNA